jgi:hypothetical protein
VGAQSSIIFDSSMLVRHDLTPTEPRNQKFISDAANKAHLISQLLLYDRIIIPTLDFAAVAACLEWLGESLFEEAIASGSIGFVRPNGLLGYWGGGVGLCQFKLSPPQGQAPLALFDDPEAATALQLQRLAPRLAPARRSAIVDITRPAIFTANHTSTEFTDRVVGYTQASINGNPPLQGELFSRIEGNPVSIGLNALPGIDQNSTRVRALGEPSDAIDLVLQVAEIHRDVLLAVAFPRADIYVPVCGELALTPDTARLHGRPGVTDGFPQLLDLNGVPDVEKALMEGMVSISDLWNLRKTPDAQSFRRWIASAHPSNARELEQAFTSVISTAVPSGAPLPVRLLRFVFGLLTGIASPSAGVVASLVDTVAGDKVLGDTSPKLFIDRYRRLLSDRGTS